MRTRDRRTATVTRVAAAEGLIHGEVQMFGPCVWRHDGRYLDTPGGAAGPLDLVALAGEAAAPVKTVSSKHALDPANRSACCD